MFEIHYSLRSPCIALLPKTLFRLVSFFTGEVHVNRGPRDRDVGCPKSCHVTAFLGVAKAYALSGKLGAAAPDMPSATTSHGLGVPGTVLRL